MPDTSFPHLDAAAARPAAEVGSAPVADSSRGMTLFVMTVATLYFGREVLVPITLALLLAFVLAPLVGLLRHLRIGRVPSVLLAVLLAVGLVLAVGGVIGSQLAELTTKLPQYAETVENKIATIRRVTVGRLSALREKIGSHVRAPAADAPQGLQRPQAPASPQAAPAPDALPSTSSPLELARRYLSPVLSPLATFGIVFIVAVFALLQQEDLRDRLIRLFGTKDLHRATVAIDDGGRRLSRYFLTQLCINTGFGCLIGIGLFFIGVPNPVLWAILSALLRFVPYIGSLISALLPIALAAAVAPGWSMPLWTFGLFVVTELVTGQAIEPLVYGHSTGLSPFSVIVAAIFWSWVWGPIGLILSTPLTLCLVVLGRHVDRLEFLDVLLGDTPALTPVENFYQRLLAGDPDEVLEEAERTLKQRSLSTYYDEVALKGLQLAAEDSQRGVLTHGQLEHVKRIIKALVHDLAGHGDVAPKAKPAQPDDTALAPAPGRRELPDNPTPDGSAPAGADLPPSWRGEAPILCLSGRGPLDEAASAMLAQLLGKHGMGARLTPYEAASRERAEMLDLGGVAMVCISYLDIAGTPAHLRYLMQRLRRKLPHGAPILVGLWPNGDAALTDRMVQTEIGADYFTSSLRDTVDVCLKVARGGS